MKTLGVVAAAVVLALGLSAAGSARSTGKAFGVGCWVGKGVWDNTANVGGTTVTFSKATFDFKLHVTKGNAVGFLNIKGHATADNPAIKASGEMKVDGELDLTGKPGNVMADGSYHLSGVVISSGVSVPLELDVDASGPMTITSVTKTTATGSLDKQKWTAHRIKGSCI